MCCAVLKDSANVRLRSVEALRDAGVHMHGDDALLHDLQERYDVGVNAHVLSRIADLGDPYSDPVGRQYIPSAQELNVKSDEVSDPIGDDAHSPVKGIIHRYKGRVLFKISNICDVYCRYCFRKEMIGAGSDHLSDDDFEAAISYLQTHSEVREVILTGGDPLILSPRRLQKVIDALNDIAHVKILRIHTRIPVANPMKIDETIISVLKTVNQSLHMVLHVNHVQEISDDVKYVIFSLKRAGISLYSQSVLLKGVNDRAEILEELFDALTLLQVHPYHLYHLDRARGTSHFRVPIEEGKNIMRELQGRLSGISMPKYMIDIPGGYGKIPINNETVCRLGNGVYSVTDYQGRTHIYEEG